MSRPGGLQSVEGEPDDELARRAAQGERAALEVLLRRHQTRVYRICRRLCANEADALDAMQEALVTVARRIDRFDGRAAFTTWLYRVTTNACLDELRRVRRRPVPLGTGDHDPPASSTQFDHGRRDETGGARAATQHADPADLAVERLALDEALAALAPEFRSAVVLRDVGGLDYAEIAEVLAVPIGTVRSRISRGRGQLARLLRPQVADPAPGPPIAGNRTGGGERPTTSGHQPPEEPTPAPPDPSDPPDPNAVPDPPDVNVVPTATPSSSTVNRSPSPREPRDDRA